MKNIKALENCFNQLKNIININSVMIVFYNNQINNNKNDHLKPSLQFLIKQKKRFINSARFETHSIQENITSSVSEEVELFELLSKHSNSIHIDEILLHIIKNEHQCIAAYLKILSRLNSEGPIYERLLNHIDEMKVSLTMLKRNITHQQDLLKAS